MTFEDQNIHVLVYTESDLNRIQKKITKNWDLKQVFLTKATTQAGNIFVKTYRDFSEQI